MIYSRIMFGVIIIQTIAGYTEKIISMGEVYGILSAVTLIATTFEVLIYMLERKAKRHYERMNKK